MNRSGSILLSAITLWAACCSTRRTPSSIGSGRDSIPASQTISGENYSGEWVGTTTTGGQLGMAGEIRSIRLDIIQTDEATTGSYACSSGGPANSVCRNSDETGTLDKLTVNGTHWRAEISVQPDSSHCTYNGVRAGDKLRGEYICYLQGAIVERGIWQAEKRFGQ